MGFHTTFTKLFVALSVFLTLGSTVVFAEAEIPASPNLADVTDRSAGLYNTEEYFVESDYYDRLGEGELSIPQAKADVWGPGYTANVDAIWYSNGTYYNISQIAKWEVGDNNVLFVEQGTIFGEQTGNTQVTASFKGKSVTIEVSVGGLAGNTMSRGASNYTSEQRTILNRATNAIDFSWTPRYDMKGWKNREDYFAGRTYYGIIYSQNYQREPAVFDWDHKNRSDFYPAFSNFGVAMPKYGLDCSGFVSYAWNIRRNHTGGFISEIKSGKYAKVGDYDVYNPSPESLKAAYSRLKSGDAIVKSGHIRLVESVQGNTVYCYEQTPQKTMSSSFTFDELANDKVPKYRYLPFSFQDAPDKSAFGTWKSTGPADKVQDANATSISGSSSGSAWVKEGSGWTYQPGGKKQIHWQKINGLWYYFNSYGVMQTGWILTGGEYYFLNGDGVMIVSAWVKHNNDWYYLRSNGAMAKSRWQKTGRNWYYLLSDGKMAKYGSLNIGGKTYDFNSNGVCTNPKGR